MVNPGQTERKRQRVILLFNGCASARHVDRKVREPRRCGLPENFRPPVS